jgi:hypothetical protein
MIREINLYRTYRDPRDLFFIVSPYAKDVIPYILAQGIGFIEYPSKKIYLP